MDKRHFVYIPRAPRDLVFEKSTTDDGARVLVPLPPYLKLTCISFVRLLTSSLTIMRAR